MFVINQEEEFMYRISELAQHVGLSRSTLLYYEKLGLISAKRQTNGYRSYSENDLQRLVLLQQLQAGGLSLKECQACLEAKVDREQLLHRLNVLDDEIAKKQKARDLLSSMLGMNSMRGWHQAIEEQAPSAHLDWLIKQGFDEKQAMRLKWLSKDMNEHDSYMKDFNLIFEALDVWGPGSKEDTLKALNAVSNQIDSILEIGCGQGNATQVLAMNSTASITAVDNEEFALELLMKKMCSQSLEHRVSILCANMENLPCELASYDLIWSEGSAYIMGVEKALKAWRPFLKEEGVLVFSDAVWSVEKPNQESLDFWQQEYPDMTTVAVRIKQAEATGYELIETFSLSEEAWQFYYRPLEARLNELKDELYGSPVVDDIERELAVFHQREGEYDYQMFILKNSNIAKTNYSK